MKHVSLLLFFFSIPILTFAQLNLAAKNTNYTIDFDNTLTDVNNGQFDGTGFVVAPATGNLDADAWAITGFSDGDKDFGIANTAGDYARNTSSDGESTGGMYAFDISNGGTADYALGFQAGGSDFTPGTIILKIDNNSGGVLSSINVSYEIFEYNDQDKSNSLNFSYSTDNSSYAPIAALDYSTVEAKNVSPTWMSTTKTTSIGGLSIADGTSFYIKWDSDEISGSGSFDQIAIDNIIINSCDAPTTQASSFATSSIANTTMDIAFTRGNGDGGVIVLAKSGSTVDVNPTNGIVYTANTAFGSGDQIGTGNYVVYKGTAGGINTATGNISISGLSEATDYHFAVFEYNTTGVCHNLTALIGNATTLCTTPINPSSFAGTTDNTQSVLSWDLPSCYDELLIVAKNGSSVTATPSGDGTAYTANAAFGSGTDLGGSEFVVYKGTGTTETITSLTNGTQYFFKIFTRKGTTWSAGVEVDATPVNIIWQEDFDGSSAITPTFSNGPEIGSTTDYYGITNDASIDATFTGDDNNFLAAQDINGSGISAGNQVTGFTVTYDNIDITGATDLYFCLDVAEDDANDGLEDWDLTDQVLIEIDIDNANNYRPAFQIEGASSGGNTVPGLDTDCDGNSDNATLTNVFTTYCVVVFGSGTALDLRISVNKLDAGDEDIAIDNLQLYDGVAAIPVPATTYECTGNLPVEFISFKGQKTNEGVQLTWKTVTELNNDYFIVQRSADGQAFENIGEVNGAGTTTELQSYDFLDFSPANGINYYRLKQVDFDGKFEYSDVITIKTEQRLTLIDVYPNPSTGRYNIQLSDDWINQTTLEVFDMTGRLVHSEAIGNNMSELNLEHLTNGNYFLKFTNESDVFTTRIVKTK